MNNMFEIVTELPDIRDAKASKIYCIKDPNSTDNENKYIEYVLVEDSDSDIGYSFEKIGQFNATPDLSGYAKLSGADFSGTVTVDGLRAKRIWKVNNQYYLKAAEGEEGTIDNRHAYVTDGGLADVGLPENFTFTLEDGSTVTKSIRVINTTTTPAT